VARRQRAAEAQALAPGALWRCALWRVAYVAHSGVWRVLVLRVQRRAQHWFRSQPRVTRGVPRAGDQC